MKPHFDVLHAPWITVVRQNGTADVGLMEAMTDPSVLAVVHPNPLVECAVHRLMLAVLAAACPQVQVGGAEVPEHYPDEAVSNYLREQASRFDLFDPHTPFLQHSGLANDVPQARSPSRLGVLWSGEKAVLTSHRHASAEDSISAREALEQLLVSHVFFRGGLTAATHYRTGSRSATGAPLALQSGRVSVIVNGRNLRHTLLLNMHRPRLVGTTAWEVGEHQAPTGYVGMLLFPSLAHLLTPSPDGSRVIGVRLGTGFDYRPLAETADDPSQVHYLRNDKVKTMRVGDLDQLRHNVSTVVSSMPHASGCRVLTGAKEWTEDNDGPQMLAFTLYGHNGSFENEITTVARLRYPFLTSVTSHAKTVSASLDRARQAVAHIAYRTAVKRQADMQSAQLRENLWHRIDADWDDLVAGYLSDPLSARQDGSDSYYTVFHARLGAAARQILSARTDHPVELGKTMMRLDNTISRFAPGSTIEEKK